MKSSLEQTEDSLSTTSEYTKLQIKENSHLFNGVDKLAADHDVMVTNTMIKITYKKALKDQNAFNGVIDPPMEPNFQGKKHKPANSDISFLGKSPREPVFHSTPKPTETEKKKKYVNGLNFTIKPNNKDGKKISSSHKVQKPPEGDVPNSDKRFLKGDGLLKSKANISRKSSGEKKTKGSDKKLKKFENGVKKKREVDKKEGQGGGVKRKASNTELNVLSKGKKMKTSESENMEVNGCAEDKIGGKKSIMLVDPDLPAGWSRSVRTKSEGSGTEQHIVYIVNPQGKKFRYKWKLRKYLQKTNSTLDADQFFFGLYPRPRASSSIERFGEESDRSKDHDLEPENEQEKQDESSNDAKSSDGKELLLFDPNLPFGWKRIIHSNATNGKKQVHIISPDGKIFRRRYLLNEYLIKHRFNHNLDKFYFGLYPKKEKNVENLKKETGDKTPTSVKFMKAENSSKRQGSAMILKKTKSTNKEIGLNNFKVGSIPPSAMLDDPKLPEGWRRFIKIRSFGESAGRMEVIIVSPDGRRHRSKKLLEHYLLQQKLNYKINDFDFTVFGKSNPKKRGQQPPQEESTAEPELELCSFLPMKKKFTDKPVPELDISSLKDDIITPEGHMINTVNGLMVCSGLSSARNERRQRLPRSEHEKQLKNHLSFESAVSRDGCEIPTFWIERLVKCRAEFRSLESDAASTIAETAKKFIKTLSLLALSNSQEPKAELKYEHLAEAVDRTECLSFLKILIPKKITFREYIKLNRPKQFLSFT